MNSNYTSVVGLVIAFLLCNQSAFSQTTFFDCSPDTLLLCVNDPGVSLPDNNQSLIGIGTQGATSCSVHLRQSRMISNTCGGDTIIYSAAIIVDTALYYLQEFKWVTLDSLGNATLTFDTREVENMTVRNNGLPYNVGCGDHYVLQWYVVDECGEYYCEEFVQLYDCKAPVFTNTPDDVFTSLLPIGCNLTLFAKDFILDLQDDCLGFNDYLYSFQESNYQPSLTYHPCLFDYGIETPVSIWVADKGRDIDCNSIIQWWERQRVEQVVKIVVLDNSSGVCPQCMDDLTVTGKMYMETQQPIKLVHVNATIQGSPLPTYVTAEDGLYTFGNISQGEVISITASRNDNHRNGVNTLDMVKIQRHLLQTELFNSPYKLIAADVNRSNGISAIDLIELRKLLLGIYSVFPNSESWEFLDAAYQFPMPSDPWPVVTDGSSIELTVNDHITDADFIGIKIGDVNNTAQANFQGLLPRSPKAKVLFEVKEQTFKSGDIIAIPVALKSDANVLGFQFTMSATDIEFLNVNAGTINIQESEFNIAGTDLSMSWFSVDPIHVGSGEKLFTIHARAKRSGSLKHSLRISSDITDAELYDAAETVYEPVLSVQSNDDGISLLPLTPNPATDYVIVPFYLPEGTTATIQVSSLDSKMLFAQEVTGHAGRNEVTVSTTQLETGMLICTMKSAGSVQAQKVVVLK